MTFRILQSTIVLCILDQSTNQTVFAINAYFDSILQVDDISKDTNQIFNVASLQDYQLSTVTGGNLIHDTNTVSDGDFLQSVTRTINITLDQYSDLAFFLDTPTNSEFYSLVENWNTTLSI